MNLLLLVCEATFKSYFSPSDLWVPWVKLKTWGLALSAFTC